MEKRPPKSADEIKLREWLTANDVYPAQEEMQSMVINSFYSELQEEQDDENLISLDEVDLDVFDISEGFDYRAYAKSDEEEDKEWEQKISFGLNNPDRFLAYINETWR